MPVADGMEDIGGGRSHWLDTCVSRPDGEIVEVEHLSGSPHEKTDDKTENPKQNLQIINDEIPNPKKWMPKYDTQVKKKKKKNLMK